MTHHFVLVGSENPRPARGFFAHNPELLGYARRMLDEGGLSQAAFYWRPSKRLCVHVYLEKLRRSGHGAVAMEATEQPPPWNLTMREHETLNHLVAGLTNAEIATRLGCSRKTVATHVERVLAKSGTLTNRGEVASVALAHSLLLAPTPDIGAFRRLPVNSLFHHTDARPAQVTTVPRKRAIRLGSIYPADRARTFDARAMSRGAALAIEEINTRGGIGGRKIEQVFPTKGLSPADAVAELHEREVDALTLGNLGVGTDLEVMRANADHPTPLLHSMVNTELSAHVEDNPVALGNLFQVCSTEAAYISCYFRTLRQLSASGVLPERRKRAAVVLRSSMSAEELESECRARSLGMDWDLETMHTIDEGTIDWHSICRDLAARHVDAVFIGTYLESHLAGFLEALALTDARPVLYTVWTPSIPNFTRRLGAAAEGLLWSTVLGTYRDPISQRFSNEYRRSYGDEPGTGSSAIHYDMVNILAAAWSLSGSPWDFDDVLGLVRRNVHRGVAGPYYFGGPGQRALSFPDDTADASLGHLHLVHQIQDGESRVISPTNIATAIPRAPG